MIVAKQVNTHVDEHTMHDPFQSAYLHSTETSLLKNDMVAILDRKSKTILVMLYLSSAFDSVVHELLMTRIKHSFGITDKAFAC